MINIKKYIEESLQDNIKRDKKTITDFIKDNYDCGGKLFIKFIEDNKYEVSCLGYVRVKLSKLREIESLTNGMFVWNEVKGDFSCGYCVKLKSLEGCPKEVKGNFYCNGCSTIKSLKGCPKKVIGDFNCMDCDYLKVHKVEGVCGRVFL